MAILIEHPDGSLSLSLHVQPGAKQTGFCGIHGAALKLRLAAVPVEGRANDALIAWLANYCGVPRQAVTIRRGETSRQKVVHVAGADTVVRERLRLLAGR